jgi:hypothetical protein
LLTNLCHHPHPAVKSPSVLSTLGYAGKGLDLTDFRRYARMKPRFNDQRICNEHISMPPKEATEKVAEDQSSFSRSTRKVRDFFSIPPLVKQLFDLVPVITYPPNQVPLRAPKPARIPSLYVFSKDQDAAAGRPSFNPSCLKWQVCAVKNPIPSCGLRKYRPS